MDSALPRVALASLKRGNPKALVLEAQFLCQGVRKPKIDAQLQNQVRNHLLATGAVKDVAIQPDPDKPLLHVEVNNICDLGAAEAKGFGTGLTFGLVGSTVKDRYVFTATLKRPNQKDIQKTYNHSIYTTIGNMKGPDGLEPLSPKRAFDKILEDLVMNLVKDLQADGAL